MHVHVRMCTHACTHLPTLNTHPTHIINMCTVIIIQYTASVKWKALNQDERGKYEQLAAQIPTESSAPGPSTHHDKWHETQRVLSNLQGNVSGICTYTQNNLLFLSSIIIIAKQCRLHLFIMCDSVRACVCVCVCVCAHACTFFRLH